MDRRRCSEVLPGNQANAPMLDVALLAPVAAGGGGRRPRALPWLTEGARLIGLPLGPDAIGRTVDPRLVPGLGRPFLVALQGELLQPR